MLLSAQQAWTTESVSAAQRGSIKTLRATALRIVKRAIPVALDSMPIPIAWKQLIALAPHAPLADSKRATAIREPRAWSTGHAKRQACSTQEMLHMTQHVSAVLGQN